MPPTANEIAAYVGLGREQHGVEFKGPGERPDRRFAARVIRATLAMCNRRDGGHVIIGVEDDGTQLHIRGLSQQQRDTWRHDHLADLVAEYADPRVVFDTDVVNVNGCDLVVVTVREFSDVPVICKKTYADGNKVILRDGAVYVRSHRKPESREVANYDEMRALIDIATDKEVRRFVTRAQAAGLTIPTGQQSADASRAYAAEREGL